MPPRFGELAADVLVFKIPNIDDPLVVAERDQALVNQRSVVVIRILFDGIQRSILARLEVSFRSVAHRDGTVVDGLDCVFAGGKRTTLVQAYHLLFGRGPIDRVEGGEGALGSKFSPGDLGFFRQISTAPDRTVAGVGLGVFLGGRPIRVRFVFEAGVAGTITGVAAVDFSDHWCRGGLPCPESSMAIRQNCHMLHARKIAAKRFVLFGSSGRIQIRAGY